MHTQSDLSFLQHLDEDISSYLRNVEWLKSDFGSKKWIISFEDDVSEINWDIELHGLQLTSDDNTALLDSFKYYLLSTVDNNGKGTNSSPTNQRSALNYGLDVIDYLLLNEETLELSTAGLGGITYNDLASMLHQFSSNSSSAETVYCYTSRATNFVLEIANNTPNSEIVKTLRNHPEINNVQEEMLGGNTFNVPIDIIPIVRAALFCNGYYSGSPSNGYHVNGKKLCTKLYPNTIGGLRIKPRLDWLSFFPHENRYNREFKSVPVRHDPDGKLSVTKLRRYRTAIYNLGMLHELGLAAPSIIDLTKILSLEVPTSSDQRFRSVPSPIIFKLFENAVEFHFKNGRMICDGFCRLAAHCKNNNLTMHKLTDTEVRRIIGTKLVSFGVRQLGLACKKKKSMKNKPSKASYYEKLRKNTGLIELLQIYVGCVQYVLGALMARRYKELLSLPLNNCLDNSQEWLIFVLRKASKNLFGTRTAQARPIDQLAVNMIRELIRLQRLLKRFGFIKNYKRLFSTPSSLGYNGLIDASVSTWYQNQNIMSDYFQAPLDNNGRRYYVRQHQLRRFFALMFFYTYGPSRLNSLRWMLGHQDVEHVYRYISDNIDESSVRGAMAQYVLEEISKGRTENYQDLADLLKEKFGTSSFGIYDEEEADIFIQSQMDEGLITMEPVFFTNENGVQVKIIVRTFTAKS